MPKLVPEDELIFRKELLTVYQNRAREMKVSKYKSPPSPNLATLGSVLKVLDCSMESLLIEAGIDCTLPEGHREMLELIKNASESLVKELSDMMDTASGGWYKFDKIVLARDRIPIVQKHRGIPHEEEYMAKYGGNVAVLLTDSSVDFNTLPYLYLGNIAKIPATRKKRYRNCDLRQSYIYANAMDISPRWFYGVFDDVCWFGYDPAVEIFYDHWSLQNSVIQKSIYHILQADQ